MGEILSQSEIDDLFKALTTGEIDVEDIREEDKKRVIKQYDFTRPSKFSKEQLRTLEIIFEGYARLVSQYLSGYLRNLVPVEVLNAEAVTSSEFTNSLSNPVILSIVDFSPFTGSIIIELSPNLGYAIIDRVLGGKGNSLEKIRDFTDIEHIILDKIFRQFASLMVEPWENVAELKPRLEKIETNSQVVQIISPNEMVALITLSVKLGSVEGMLNVCIPHIVIESIMDKLNTKYWFAHKEHTNSASYHHEVQKLVKTASIPIKAVLGKTHISVREFLELQQSDIIKLDTNIDSPVEVHVGNIFKFTAKPGAYKNKSAIQIDRIITREDE